MTNSEVTKNKLNLKYPASWWRNMWREGLPSGNGKIGASVYGGVKEETILLNHNKLWHLGRKDTLPDVGHTLAETRKLMLESKYLEASWHLTNQVKDSGYATELASRLPLGDIKLSMPCSGAFRKYGRSVDMETGEVTVRWEDANIEYERKLFVSRTDDVVVYEISSSEGIVEGEFWLNLHQTDDPDSLAVYKKLAETLEVKTDGSYLYYAATNDDGKDFGAVLRVIASDGRITAKDGKIQFAEANKVLALAKVFTHGDREQEWIRLHNELSSMDQTYKQLLASHLIEHQRLFLSTTLNLFGEQDHLSNEELLLHAYDGEAPTSLIEKMWAYGRYLFISGTASDGMPFEMYGLWAGDYKLTWSHNMANENVQMMYWHAMAGGLSEMMPALVHYYESMMDDFKDNAKKLFGCRGIYIPAGTTPGIGVPNQIVPVIMNWTSAAGWLARHYYEYYLYTGDKEFLLEKVLPFMKQIAMFYEDYLDTDENGRICYFPSVSPENTPLNFMPKDGKPLAHPMPTTINATMDLAILKELLTHLIQGSQEVGVYADEIGKWANLLERIPAYQINEDGALREWMHPDFDDRYEHRHLSHIYPIFPGQEFTRELSPELFDAFETAVKKRLIGAQSGWSLAHMAAVYARLGDGSSAVECLDILSRSCLLNNFFTLHNDWRNMGICMNMVEAPIQLDASMGWVNAVQEMLLYVSPWLVKLLPAVPDKWKKGEFTGLCFTTGTISMSWDKQIGKFQANLVANRETNITLKLPEWFNEYSFSGSGVAIASSTFGKGYYELKMMAGQSLVITVTE
ncbi:glycoside hydrolase N-terminal domain-containing protein [Paenibacillus sp. LjRoot153]|uniref:glycosyl hydrolase family 95 catalytic domain-containing protein n=1 Tax=unclassified Paenibacillus TaxID=185978 RepID=UPI000709B0EB|nr:glycoside hydrolase N-terminal domain-containing protein [Paenibacillus sp. Soil766]KRF09742.1 alpha-L-fucosidase [Paenibacillus sp. Soil766]